MVEFFCRRATTMMIIPVILWGAALVVGLVLIAVGQDLPAHPIYGLAYTITGASFVAGGVGTVVKTIRVAALRLGKEVEKQPQAKIVYVSCAPVRRAMPDAPTVDMPPVEIPRQVKAVEADPTGIDPTAIDSARNIVKRLNDL